MGREEIQKILDGLDTRLALGEIDLGTYNTLKMKFIDQLVDKPSGSPLDSAASALGREAVALKCPSCMAPLPVAGPGLGSVTCEYCGSTAALQTARSEMEKLRGDVRKWIRDVAGTSASGDGVDAAARQFIFRDKLWPQLKTATDRATELYHPTRYLPLFSFPLLDRLGHSPFMDALVMTPDLASLTDRLKGVVAQVQAPELTVFAVGDREKCELHTLEVGSMEITYLSNVRHRLQGYSAEGFAQARANLRALNELYSAAARMSAGVDPSYAAFTKALAARVAGVDQAVEVLARLLAPSEGLVTDPVVAMLDEAAEKCGAAAGNMESAGREPKESAPAAEGTRNDAQAIRMLADTVRIYAECAAEAGEPFGAFLDALSKAQEQALPPAADADWLQGFLDTLARHIGAVGGEVAVPVVSDFTWVESAAASGVHSSMFGGKETYLVGDRMLLPYWASEIHFSEHSGAWFWKKGQAAHGLLLMDATRHGGQCYIEPAGSPLVGQCYSAVETPRPIGQFASAVAPAVSGDTAHRCMKGAVNNSQQYRGAIVKPPTIIYLPAAQVTFSGRKGERREVYLPGATPRTVVLNLGRVRLGTRELLLALQK